MSQLVSLMSRAKASAVIVVVSMVVLVGCMPKGIDYSSIKTFSDRLATECFNQLVKTGGANNEDLCEATCVKKDTGSDMVDKKTVVSPQLDCVEGKIRAELKLTKEDIDTLQKKDPDSILDNIKEYTQFYGITSTCEAKELCDKKLAGAMKTYVGIIENRVALIKVVVGTATAQWEALNIMHIDYPSMEQKVKDNLDSCFEKVQKKAIAATKKLTTAADVNKRIAETMCMTQAVDEFDATLPGPQLVECFTWPVLGPTVAEAFLVKQEEAKERPANDEKLIEYRQKARKVVVSISKEKTVEYWKEFSKGPFQPKILRAFLKYYVTDQACARVMRNEPLGNCVVERMNDRIDIMNAGLHPFYTGIKAKAEKIQHRPLTPEKPTKCPKTTDRQKKFLADIQRS